MKRMVTIFCAAALWASAAETQGKYNPGHYVALEAGAKLETFPHLDEPAIRGFNIRYMWATLEPEEGRYDFSVIRRDLAVAAKHGRQLVAFLIDKSFGEKAPNPIPVHMRGHALTNLTGGLSAKKWDQRVVEREIALSRALAKEFDSDPNFEGIAWQESAPSVPSDQLTANGYTPELFRDSLIQLLKGSSEAFPRSWVFWYQNFLPGKNEYLAEIAQAVLPYRVVLGGPDILPYRTALLPNYKLYDVFQGKMKLSSSAQADSYRHHKADTSNGAKRVFHSGAKPIHPGGYVTMQQIFEYGRDRMHLNYIFWSYVKFVSTKQYPGDPKPFVFDDTLEVIRRNPTFN